MPQPVAGRGESRHVLLSVGDDSADLHAANLMRAMRDLEPAVRFAGFGMDRMAEAGLEPLAHGGGTDGAMWLHNILRVGHYRRRLALCCHHLDSQRPDLVLPVDFGGFNLCLCREAAARRIPVFYYIPPQVWAHGTYRLKKLKKWVTKVGLIYPFEAEPHRRYGVPAEYVGHPLFDELDRNPPSAATVAQLRQRFGENLVGVFPGSRRQEVVAHLPLIVESCRRIRQAVPGASFAVLGGPRTRGLIADLLKHSDGGLEVLEDVRPVELARASRLCLTKSGTITLEIASQGTPMVIFYRVSPVVAFLAYGLSDTPCIGLINLLARRVICPEKATTRNCADWVAEQALRLLQDAEAYEACRRAIREALSGFALPGASVRAARIALALM